MKKFTFLNIFDSRINSGCLYIVTSDAFLFVGTSNLLSITIDGIFLLTVIISISIFAIASSTFLSIIANGIS